jgi:hypothetical protein
MGQRKDQAMKKIALIVCGLIGVGLGGLWLLQGLGLVRIAPILCVADCHPLEGPSPTWAVIGLVAFVGGAFALFQALRPRVPR